jgi:hypothetical protein
LLVESDVAPLAIVTLASGIHPVSTVGATGEDDAVPALS